MTFDAVVARLATLPAPLPEGPDALMPVFTDGAAPAPTSRDATTARPAAVLVLVFPDADGLARIVLTERVSYDGHHSGEVSLPGGKAEPADADAPATALREAREEVGLDVDDAGVRVVGRARRGLHPGERLPDHADRGGRRSGARSSAANLDEVARILTPPVSAFLPGAPIEIVERTIGDWPIRYGGYRIDGLHVWGATARILGQLGAVLDPARE